MANAYATLAAGGVRHKPTAIARVEFPDGKSENLAKSEGKRVMTDGQAYEVTKVLEMNVQSGTGVAASYGCPAAGKTGTTDQATDAWFVGYTPKLSTAVWVGYPDARVAMPGAQGGSHAAPVWHAFMVPAHGEDCDGFPEPEEPAEFEPFFGKYATGGGGGSYSSDDYDYSSGGYTEGPTTGGTGTGDPGSGAYEAPPQEAPDVAPPPDPSPAPVDPAPQGTPGGGGVQTP
jgi:penicillin-binding protein 1A